MKMDEMRVFYLFMRRRTPLPILLFLWMEEGRKGRFNFFFFSSSFSYNGIFQALELTPKFPCHFTLNDIGTMTLTLNGVVQTPLYEIRFKQ